MQDFSGPVDTMSDISVPVSSYVLILVHLSCDGKYYK